MSLQTPLPFAFAQREEFLKLPLENRTAHLWHALKFCKEELGGKRFAAPELERNIRVLQRMMLEIAKHMATKLRDEGAWKDESDVRWPRNHVGSDQGHWYDSGAFPPQFLAIPRGTGDVRGALDTESSVLIDEMIAWAETPAGHAAVEDAEIQSLLAEHGAPAPANQEPAKPEPARLPSIHEAEAAERSRKEAFGWLSDRTADGSLSSWASKWSLQGVDAYLGGATSQRRSTERILPELIKLEQVGDWQRLQEQLTAVSPKDAEQLSKLRGCLPKPRG
jgi:hypothetical protein